VFKRRVDGNAEPEVLWKTGAHTHVTDWSPDGATIVLEVVHPERRSDLLLLGAGGGTPAPFLASPFSEQAARVSPDGRWVAYQSNESGTIEIYLESFPAPGRKVQVSTEGGVQPWSRDARCRWVTCLPGSRVTRSDRFRGWQMSFAAGPTRCDYELPLTQREYSYWATSTSSL
jgi:dipeptidyl aminopeptidase/acylaminoacyl peptidase